MRQTIDSTKETAARKRRHYDAAADAVEGRRQIMLKFQLVHLIRVASFGKIAGGSGGAVDFNQESAAASAASGGPSH
jgi:hypothetical protein